MSQRLTVLASLALSLLTGTAWAQGDPQSVGVAVDGTVVDVPVDLAQLDLHSLDLETHGFGPGLCRRLGRGEMAFHARLSLLLDAIHGFGQVA